MFDKTQSVTLAAPRPPLCPASKSSRSRTYDLLPEVDVEAGYMHMTGQTFVKPDSAFIGLRAGWQI